MLQIRELTNFENNSRIDSSSGSVMLSAFQKLKKHNNFNKKTARNFDFLSDI